MAPVQFPWFLFMLMLLIPGLSRVCNCDGFERTVEMKINLDKIIHITSDKFLSVQFDTGMISRHWKQMNFNSTKFLTLCKGLHPSYVRIGGTAQDMLHFQKDMSDGLPTFMTTYENEDAYWDQVFKVGRQPFVKFNMTGKQFDEVYHFFTLAGFRVIFGLNALIRVGANWDPSNAITFLDYCGKQGYQMDFQLGNEPNDFHKYNFTVKPQDLGDDFRSLRKILDSYPIYKNSRITGPDTTNPDRRKTLQFFYDVVKHAAPVLHAVTWHQYYMNGRIATIDDFLDPQLLDDLPICIEDVKNCMKNYKHPSLIWLGETASTFGGGTPGLSDRYVAGFMWLDKLGLSARLGLDVVVRQSIIGGHYALIRRDEMDDFDPNPDYWLSFLYKSLVGRQVLNATVSKHAESVRMYAHCTNTERTGYPSGSVTVYGLNLLKKEVVVNLPSQLKNIPIEQYLLTPHNGNLKSRFVDLNYKKLEMIGGPKFPKMEPVVVKNIVLPPRTFGFFVLPSAAVSACGP